MSKRLVQRLCRDQGAPVTPACNTTLYLQGLKFGAIEGLDDYTAVRVLHLENNCLRRLGGGLAHLAGCLRALYLNHNHMSAVAELAAFTQLELLSLSGNRLSSLEGLPPSLNTLHVAKAALSRADDVASIARQCPALQVLDISDNELQGEDCLAAVTAVATLSVLYAQRNGFTQIAHWRKTVIAALPKLTYLDEAPVEEVDRVGAAAWLTGGREAELQAKLAYRDEKRRQQRQSTVAFARERARRRLQQFGGLSGVSATSEDLAMGSTDHIDSSVRSLINIPHTVPAAVLDSLRLEEYRPPAAAGAGGGSGGGSSDDCEVGERSEPSCVIGAGGGHRAAGKGQQQGEEEEQAAGGVGAECAVCSEHFVAGDRLIGLPCRHAFHDRCVRPWLENFSNSCPLCRTLVCTDHAEAAAAAVGALALREAQMSGDAAVSADGRGSSNSSRGDAAAEPASHEAQRVSGEDAAVEAAASTAGAQPGAPAASRRPGTSSAARVGGRRATGNPALAIVGAAPGGFAIGAGRTERDALELAWSSRDHLGRPLSSVHR